MWRLKSIYIENIVSFREAKLAVKQGVATLIFGRNEDNASQPCNGSGKSSLIEAIAFGLTGEQLRKVKSIEEIINDNADEASVSLQLCNDYNNTTFIVNRTISRNAPQVIECHKYDSDGNEIEKDKTIQPTVADYNKFILNEIGLSKDDIYNNYILCDNKYESFFDCSDKGKKEIINRFSNGVIIDESIERVHKDMEPVHEALLSAESKVVNIKGSISAIENELANVDEKKAKAADEREARIARLDERMTQCRERITEKEAQKEKAEKRLELLLNLQEEVKNWESAEIPLSEAYDKIKTMCETHEIGEVSDFVKISEDYKTDLVNCKRKLEGLGKQIETEEEKAAALRKAYDQSLNDYQKQARDLEEFSHIEQRKVRELDKELGSIDKRLDELDEVIKNNKSWKSDLVVSIESLKALIEGAVKCPNCGHQFELLSNKSVDELKNELSKSEKVLSNLEEDGKKYNKEYNDLSEDYARKEREAIKIEDGIKSRNAELNKLYDSVHEFLIDADNADSGVAALKRELTFINNDIDRISGRIEVLRNRLFGEIEGLLEGRVNNGKRYIEQVLSDIEFEQGKLAQYRASKKELVEAQEIDFEASLKESLKKYQADLQSAEETAKNVRNEYDKLKEQEINFTMFKSHIARKKIDALSHIVNDFLEKIGSDIRLRLEGFSVTKTGKLRDKISVQVMRDGIDCGSYHKFSGGEKARLNLACILSLHTLTNTNCEEGKGLDFIIIDELLDKSDEMGMMTYCEALNKLKQTSLLITQGGVSEGYPHKLLITKKQGISTISNQ